MKKFSSGRNFQERSTKPQVFINFRGEELRYTFVSYLKTALERNGINAYTDSDERKGVNQNVYFKRIEESKIALAIFSSKYTQSKWCLNELAKMKECMESKDLVVIPIFYIVTPCTVRDQKEGFGALFRELAKNFDDVTKNKWIEALKSISTNIGITYDGKRDQTLFIDEIVKEVEKELTVISSENEEEQKTAGSSNSHHDNNMVNSKNITQLVGLKQRLEELNRKVDFGSDEEIRIVAVIGLPGIGKTTLVKKLYDDNQHLFQRHVHMVNIHERSEEFGKFSLRRTLLKELLRNSDVNITEDTTHASVASELLKMKVFLVLDNVSCKKQIDILLGDYNWIKKGSRILITTRDKTSVVQFQHTYVVPRLDLTDGLKHFSTYAFKDHNCPSLGNFKKLSTKFVDYARGNPLALQILGLELLSKDEAHWSEKIDTLAQKPCPLIEDLLTESYASLSEKQKETFLLVACFFRSGDEYYVRSLVDSADGGSEISNLADKLLISITSGRVEMHDLLYTFAKNLWSSVSIDNNWESQRIWHHGSFTAAVNKDVNQKNKRKYQYNLQKESVMGISLDLSELNKKLTLNSEIFSDMCNLRYVKIYDSQCSRNCADCKLTFPDGFNWSLENIRYLHWLQYPLKTLPVEIDPKNLVELSLPYSKITQLWKNVKDTSKLKWVDLSHSHELHEISGLVQSQNLQRLNLEGCTSLETLPQEMQELNSLAYLNLRGCTSLTSLPDMKFSSLKILILSYCSNLKKLQVISKDLEALYLEATAIKKLPASIGDLQKLVFLNMKDCKALVSLPDCFGNLCSLEELILSGCLKLVSFPNLENMESLKVLLLDGTTIKQMPRLLHCTDSGGQAYTMPTNVHHSYGRSSSLLSLCLSGSKFESLNANISQLYHLKWLDLKNCKELKSLPVLPPNLKCLDAHGCDSLESVASPLATLVVTVQIHCSLIFTNCNKLDQAAKSSIISFTHKKGQLISDAHTRYNEGFVLDSLIGTCFPGCEVPEMFDYQTFGSQLEQRLPRHWCDSKLIGIALCAVILFPDQQESNRFLVKCTCKFRSEEKVCISFRSIVGGWSESGDEPRKIKSAHVFIGYTSWVDISKRHMEDHGNNGEGCIPSKVTLTFEVTDDATNVVKCEMVKSGFALVYTPCSFSDLDAASMCI